MISVRHLSAAELWWTKMHKVAHQKEVNMNPNKPLSVTPKKASHVIYKNGVFPKQIYR